jgi:hypothetical protein
MTSSHGAVILLWVSPKQLRVGFAELCCERFGRILVGAHYPGRLDEPQKLIVPHLAESRA